MRLSRMSTRSVYWGLPCRHCSKKVSVGRVFFGLTLFVSKEGDVSSVNRYERVSDTPLSLALRLPVRVVYHRSCIEGILEGGPLDPEVEASMFDQYRERLLEQYREIE